METGLASCMPTTVCFSQFMRIDSEKAKDGWCSRFLLIVGCVIFAISACGTTAPKAASPSATSPSPTATHQVSLSWSAPNNSPVVIVGYNIYRSAPDNSSSQRLNLSVVTGSTYVDSTVQGGLSYKYAVKSVDASGVESDPSNTFNVTIP
jgi:fibronectin type 3 domain-containing protein